MYILIYKKVSSGTLNKSHSLTYNSFNIFRKTMIIYKTTNLLNGKIYVGLDTKNRPKYLGSGRMLNSAIKKYGRENFKKEIIEHCETFEELKSREVYWIKELKSRVEFGNYNLTDGGDGMINLPKVVREQMSKKAKGRTPPNKGQKGVYHHSEETKEIIGQKGRGLKRSELSKEKISLAKKGKNNPMYGKGKSEETVKKFKEKTTGELNHFYGKKHSDETKAKMRLAKAWSKYKKLMGIDLNNLNTIL